MYKLTRKSELKTASWAGGTTTQLAIHPSTAEYQKFNFDYRISYATVEVDESTFTFMPGVTRHLMILKGALYIDHTDRYAKHLKKFDVDVFDGEWPTKAKGRVMDFNLMTRGEAKGEVQAVIFDKSNVDSLILEGSQDVSGAYLLSGNLQVSHNSEAIELNEGDFILFDHKSKCSVSFYAEGNAELIIATVKL